MKIGSHEFDISNETYVMGILNVTPDSFSDGGHFHELDKALFHAEEMISEGAAIIDIGGESTRPGYMFLSDEEEIERVIPVIEALKKRFDIPLSLDTYKSEVAKAGICAGVDLINDVWGLKYDKHMAQVIAASKVSCCLMHNRRELKYADYFEDFKKDMKETLDIAKKAGIEKDKIILDPGVGFAKTRENNLQIINHLEILTKMDYPVLLGTSRKSVIGQTLLLPVDERIEGTLVTTVFGVLKGCSFVRVHDVKENIRAIQMTKALMDT